MKTKKRMQRFLSIFLACIMMLNVPMSVLASEGVQILDASENVELLMADDGSASLEEVILDEQEISGQVSAEEQAADASGAEAGDITITGQTVVDAAEPSAEEKANAENADAENANAENADAENANAGNADAENANAGNAGAENANAGNANAGNAGAENANAENANAENAENAGAEYTDEIIEIEISGMQEEDSLAADTVQEAQTEAKMEITGLSAATKEDAQEADLSCTWDAEKNAYILKVPAGAVENICMKAETAEGCQVLAKVTAAQEGETETSAIAINAESWTAIAVNMAQTDETAALT